MVMETPSPQSVGREFVRQYYTVLNQAPLHLHRFYNNNSSFLHGGLEGKESKPAYGQQEIHKRIMQLNFRDCHAKIRQVDSHTTLGDGVVVQVGGELSNAGQTMRRFMQTFVLAPQSPKQYYVHNDIFRYQDEVFDEDDESDARENLQDLDVEQSDQSMRDEVLNCVNSMQDASQSIYYQSSVPKMSNGTVHIEEPAIIANVEPAAPVQPISSSVQPAPVAPATTVPTVTPPSPLPSSGPMSHSLGMTPDSEESETQKEEDSIGYKEPEDEEEEEEEDEEEDATRESAAMIEAEPKTYANMVRNSAAASAVVAGSTATTLSGGGFVSRATATNSARTSSEKSTTEVSSQWSVAGQQRGGFRGSRGGVGGVRPSYGNGERMNSSGRDRKSTDENSFGSNSFGSAGGFNSSYSGGDGGERRRSGMTSYPDNQQVFVGNLPLEVTEDELRQHFSTYGNVVDIRINNKPGIGKQGPGGSRVPNFGFVVFDDASSVHKILAEKQVMFNEHRLNVEEKKPRQGGRPGGPNRSDGSSPGGGSRGGFGMGRGLSRGGGRGGGIGGGGPRGGLNNRPTGGFVNSPGGLRR